VIEVAYTSLVIDRTDKGRIYASAGIPIYWIVNIQDRQIEVYSSPSGRTASPSYAQRQDYKVNDVIPLVLDGTPIASFPVKDLLP
jgi:Uma2 family endonuclease